ncbi:MAG: hypothetical protein R3F07_14565 [Opitutaceae bacterium]
MRNKIGWWKRDDDGRKFQVQFRYFGDKPSWHCQMARFEDWQPYEPTDEDWDKAIQDMTDRLNRGLIRAHQLEMVKKRGSK